MTPSMSGDTATTVRPWPLVAANTCPAAPHTALAISKASAPVGTIGPPTAAAHSTSAASSSVSIAYCWARSVMIMSRIDGDERLMSCLLTLT